MQKFGDARVALIGFPSVGKSTLLSQLTGTESEAAAYEFTTLTCIPGTLHYNDARIQVSTVVHSQGLGLLRPLTRACVSTLFFGLGTDS